MFLKSSIRKVKFENFPTRLISLSFSQQKMKIAFPFVMKNLKFNKKQEMNLIQNYIIQYSLGEKARKKDTKQTRNAYVKTG